MPGVVRGKDGPGRAHSALVGSPSLACHGGGARLVDGALVLCEIRVDEAARWVAVGVRAQHLVRGPLPHPAQQLMGQLPGDARSATVTLHRPVGQPQVPQALKRLLELAPALTSNA